MDFFKKIYGFFSSPDTPGSGFYMALIPIIGSLGDFFLNSGNPIMMAIGGGIAAVYAGAHAIGQGIAQKPSAPAVTIPVVNGTPTVNDTPFGEPKVGPDTRSSKLQTLDTDSYKMGYHDSLLMSAKKLSDPPSRSDDTRQDMQVSRSLPTAADMALGQPPASPQPPVGQTQETVPVGQHEPFWRADPHAEPPKAAAK